MAFGLELAACTDATGSSTREKAGCRLLLGCSGTYIGTTKLQRCIILVPDYFGMVALEEKKKKKEA